MTLELELALGRMSLAQGALDVALAFALFVVFRLVNLWQRRRHNAEYDARELERLREESRKREELEYEQMIAKRKRRR